MRLASPPHSTRGSLSFILFCGYLSLESERTQRIDQYTTIRGRGRMQKQSYRSAAHRAQANQRHTDFPAAECEILDTWHSIGLRGTGSHDYAVADVFVPTNRSLSLREPPVEQGPLYALPTIAIFGALLAAVPLGIARHAIDILVELAGTKLAARSRKLLREDVTMQANLGRAEALLRSGRAFLYGALEEAWQVVSEGSTLSLAQRATLWLASTHAANTAKEATELMFSAGGSASPYVSSGLERCVRDIHAAAQHLTVAPANYQMAGQAFLGSDMRSTPLLFTDDRSTE